MPSSAPGAALPAHQATAPAASSPLLPHPHPVLQTLVAPTKYFQNLPLAVLPWAPRCSHPSSSSLWRVPTASSLPRCLHSKAEGSCGHLCRVTALPCSETSCSPTSLWRVTTVAHEAPHDLPPCPFQLTSRLSCSSRPDPLCCPSFTHSFLTQACAPAPPLHLMMASI